MRKGLFTLFLVGSIIFVFTFSTFAEGPIILKLGGTNPPESIEAQSVEVFRKYVEEKTNGEVLVKYFPGAQLGDGHTEILNVQVGIQDLFFASFDFYAEYIADLNIMGMAFAIRNREHLVKFLDSSFLQETVEGLRDKLNTRVLSNKFFCGSRAYISKKPIFTPDDMKGLKVRIPNIPIWEKNFKQLGAVPTVIAWSEYPFALMQGVIEGGEAMLSDIYPKKLHEGAPYITVVDFAWPVNVLTINEKLFQSFSPEIQNILLEAADKMAKWFSDEIINSWENTKLLLLEEGAFFIEVDKEPFAKKMSPLAEQLEKEGFWDTKGLYQKVQDLLHE